jgi:hypothetical protein
MTWLAEAALDQGQTGHRAERLLTTALSLAASLGRSALRSRPRGIARKGLRLAPRKLSSQALALDNKASIIHYSLAMAYRGPVDHRRAESHLQQRGSVADSAGPFEEGSRRDAAQRAHLRKRTPTLPVTGVTGPPRGVSQEGRGLGPHPRVTRITS